MTTEESMIQGLREELVKTRQCYRNALVADKSLKEENEILRSELKSCQNRTENYAEKGDG